jgi:NPCBM/NEW2 domain
MITRAKGIGIILFTAAQMGWLSFAAQAYGPDVQGWAAAVFGGAPAPSTRNVAALELRRQDFGQLGINQSAIGTTPLRIARQSFAHGLGTHANSEIVVHFPAGTARTFRALVGVDNNYATHGTSGSVEFSVEIGGRSVFHSRTLRGRDTALPVEVPIPSDAAQLVLKVDMTADGPSCDHADWAKAHLVMKDGSTVWLDELPLQPDGDFWPAAQPPFSFVYHGESSGAFLGSWKRETHSRNMEDRTVYKTQWTDPQTGLIVTAHATAFKDFAAVEWYLTFQNGEAQDGPILEKVQALDVGLKASAARKLLLDQIKGDDASERSFVPSQRELATGEAVALAPVGGRPSSGTFPIFNLQRGAQGLFTAIGWTGDYYLLTPWTMASDQWMAWQLHRADLDEGIVLAFRHQDCPYSALQVTLREIKPDQRYVVHFIDEQHHGSARTLSGRQLAALELKIPARHQSLLVRYAPARHR